MGVELNYRAGGLRARKIGKLFRVGYRSVSRVRRRLGDRLKDKDLTPEHPQPVFSFLDILQFVYFFGREEGKGFPEFIISTP